MSVVLVADGHALCRAGLIALCRDDLALQDVAAASSLAEMTEHLDCDSAVSLAVVDLGLPGLAGLDGLARVRARWPRVRIVALAAEPNRTQVLSALAAGIHGLAPKDLSASALSAALRAVLSGQIYVPPLVSLDEERPQLRRHAAGRAPLLTERQQEVLKLLARGRSNKEIGRALNITEGTVKVHITAAFRQLGVHNRVSAASAFNAIDLSGVEPLLPGLAFEDRRAPSVRQAG